MRLRTIITGLIGAIKAMAQNVFHVKPSTGSTFGRSIQIAGERFRDAARDFTHVETGTLRDSHMVEVSQRFGGVEARIFPDPSKQKPGSDEYPAEYGPIEHARGGDHAFYDLAIAARGEGILNELEGRISAVIEE